MYYNVILDDSIIFNQGLEVAKSLAEAQFSEGFTRFIQWDGRKNVSVIRYCELVNDKYVTRVSVERVEL